MFGFFRSRLTPAPQTSALATIALPLAINIEGQDKIDHALYRLDQIARHWEQHSEISAQKVAEFTAEALTHVVNLKHTALRISDEQQRAAFLAKVEKAASRLRSLGWDGRV